MRLIKCFILGLVLLISPCLSYACHPTLKCVQDNEDGNFTAIFGYVGKESYIPIGYQNKFIPDPKDRGQGTNFSQNFVTEHIKVVFPKDSSVAWKLKFTTVTATKNSTRCSDHKVDICHIPPGNPTNAHTISIDDSAVPAHLAHGDSLGECPKDCAGTPLGDSVVDLCGICGGDNSACKDCAGVPNGKAVVDECGVCGGDNSTCKDCSGVPNGSSTVDNCGVCDSNKQNDNMTCLGCDGVPNSEKTADACGVCGGDNSTCKDCAGIPNGTSKIDMCGVCRLPEDPAMNSTCKDCIGIPNGNATVDSCGKCLLPESQFRNQCLDCAGVPFGTSFPDLCGVCGGTNSCTGCDGVPNSGKVVDKCGVCGGDGTSCTQTCPVTHIDIDESSLIAGAKRLHSKVVKYSNRAVSCNLNQKKSSKKRISKSVNVLTEFVTIVNSLKLDVNLCPGECAEAINKEEISKLKKLSSKLYKYASDSQHAGRSACKNKDTPVAKTKKDLTDLITGINNCPTKVCK